MRSISIIDDDVIVREGIADLVKSLGYVASAFESAEEFLAAGQIEHTLCVITDLQMPGLSGLALQDALIRTGHSTPIIFVTAFPRPSARAAAMEAGAVAFLSKPFDEADLIRSIESAIEKLGQIAQ
jgi:FixJ family two-component response regulator